MLNCFFTTSGQINFTPDASNSGMIFSKLTNAHISHESCSLFYFYDMRELYEMGNQIERAIENLNGECDKTLDSTCRMESNLLNEQYQYIQQNLKKIHPKNISRRSICEWCGKVQHFLYGTVDADEAREIMGVINNSSDAITANRNMINNTAHIMEAMLEEEENKVNKIQDTLNELYANTQQSINDKLKRRDIISITRALINEYKTLVESVDQAFTTERGQTPRIVKTKEFRTRIQAVAKSLKPGKRFPIDVFENDISEIFNFATVKTGKMENRIILKIILPICETETYKLFKATRVPIITDKFCLIANIENSHFIINKEKTEYTELSSEDVENGIRVNDNNVLYRVNALTKTNPKANCIWSQFLNNEVNLLTTICKLSPIPKTNYITTINDNDLFHITVVEPLMVWETCEEDEKKYRIKVTGFLQSKPGCLIRADDFMIKSHDNIILNFTTSIQPFRFGGSFSMEAFENITKTLPDVDTKFTITVIDSKSKIAMLRAETEKLIDSTNKKVDLKRLTHDASWFSFSFSLSFKRYIIIGSLIMVMLALVCTYYYSCLSLGCLCDLLKKKKRPESFQLKQNSKRKYRKTPYVSRKILHDDIELGNESDENI